MGKGLLILAIGLGVAYMAHQRSKKKQQSHALPAAGMAAGAAVAAGSYAAAHSGGSSLPPPSSGGRPKLRDAEAIFTHLAKAVRAKQLEGFYPPRRDYSDLHALATHIAQSGTLEILADGWDLPDAFALDLVQLALYDMIVLADDSGSMNGGNNLRELMAIVEDVADVGTAFDSNGIEIRFMNSQDQGNNVRNEQEILNLFQRNPPRGRTPIGASLRDKILRPLVVDKARQNALRKPVLVLVLTDGAATDQYDDAVPRVISDAVRDLKKATGKEQAPVFFSFGQVGTDREAVEWLDSLDNDRSIGGYIDVTSAPAIETAQVMKALDKGVKNAPPEWQQLRQGLKANDALWRTIFRLKRMLGGIDSWYDQSDEKGKKRWSFSSDAEYHPHWSEVQGREAQFKAENKSRGYVWVAGGGGGHASSFGQSFNSVQQPYGQPAGHGQPQSYGQPGFQSRDTNSPYPPAGGFSAPYPPSNAPYPPANAPYPGANAPYPPAGNAPYPPPGGSAPYPPFGAPGGFQQAYPPPNNDFNAPPQGSPYPPANNQQAPYPPGPGFAGGFSMPEPRY